MSSTTKEFRPYQLSLIRKIGLNNVICVMPTGSGKTIVAAGVVQHVMEAFPAGLCLFLVPTRELVNQQALVLEEWCPGVIVRRYHGGLSDSLDSFQVLVSTSAAFIALKSNNSQKYSWSFFSLVIFDEVHHVLKDHPYRRIAKNLLLWHSEQSDSKVQLVGLSASLTYSVTENDVNQTLTRLCSEISTDLMLAPTLEELEEGGYQSQSGRDVQVLSTKYDPEGILPHYERKPHLMHSTFMSRFRGGTMTAFSYDVMKVVLLIESYATTLDSNFQPQVAKINLSSWEAYAHNMIATKKDHSATSDNIFALLESWYVALRILVQTWEGDVHTASHWLKMNSAISRLPPSIQSSNDALRLKNRLDDEKNQSKLISLRNQVQCKKKHFGNGFKCIIFVQQRVTAHVLANYLNEIDPTLRAGFVASRGSIITPSIKVTPTDVVRNVQAFREGTGSVLVATSVIEEGFDVPEANVVILYDHMKDSVELCQRFGRARASECHIVVMDERNDRPVEFLQNVRNMQHDLVRSYNPDICKARKNCPIERQKQIDRDRSGNLKVLSNLEKCLNSPTAAFHEYSKVTKASIEEKMCVESCGKFLCKIKYSTILQTLQATATATSKKGAKAECCKMLLSQLKK
jgi:ERCC4-related helicase